MRPLTEEETSLVFAKLASFIGDNVSMLIDRNDGDYCFRNHKERVYYCSENLMRQAACIAREPLLAFGTCLGKFTKSKKFHLQITALDYLAPYSKYKVWLKPNAEQQFLYGNNILKSGIARMTDGTPTHAGIVVFSMTDVPLGSIGPFSEFSAVFCHFVNNPITVVKIAAVASTLSNGGYLIQRCSDTRDTAAFLKEVTVRLQNKACCEEISGVAFSQLQNLLQKKKAETVKDAWIRQLMVCPGMSQARAEAIADRFPSMKALLMYFVENGDDAPIKMLHLMPQLTRPITRNLFKFFVQ
uniref:Crossover junction endonuclease MUS81 n=1 Tax=Caenorhabditis japonica TaxID=281687 RepID=A0A8R1DMW8_CAEJA